MPRIHGPSRMVLGVAWILSLLLAAASAQQPLPPPAPPAMSTPSDQPPPIPSPALVTPPSAAEHSRKKTNGEPRRTGLREKTRSAAAELGPAKSPEHPTRAAHGMVVSDEALASQAGLEILKRGGNAVDAAVAVAFALAVVEPEAGNLGGGGFMLVRLADGRAQFLDFREVAPQRASRNMYLRASGSLDPAASTVGYRAVAVPGTVAGMTTALQQWGSESLSAVMLPAIHLARNGFPVSPRLAALLKSERLRLQGFPLTRKIFLNNGRMFEPGEILRQPELAATLERIAVGGAAEFYRGHTARLLAGEMARHGGLITLRDLAAYQAKIREPLYAAYQSNGARWSLITSPPPSSGGIMTIEALNILAPIALRDWSDAQSVHWVAETLRRIFADRAAYMADADFVHVPVKGLTDPRYAAELRKTIDPKRATSSRKLHAGNPTPFDGGDSSAPALAKPAAALGQQAIELPTATAPREPGMRESNHTTHFSVVDAAGNAVANTYTLNDSFGSAVTCAAGFLLNDEMDDFTSAPGRPNMFGLLQSQANAISPGKRPLSSMMPSILLREGKLSFVTGSPGGPRIVSATLLSLLNWMRLGMDAQRAINAPRFHQQWQPDLLYLEPELPSPLRRELQRRGYVLGAHFPDAPHDPIRIGEVEAIAIDPQNGDRLGAADPRRGGAAAGY